MKYSKLVFRENAWPDSPGQSVTIDFVLNEIVVDSLIEGVKWCRIGSRERSAIEAKLNASHPDEWTGNCIEPVPDGPSWNLRLFDADGLVRESGGCSAYPPREQWSAFSSLVDFCFAVTRRYGEYRPPKAV